LITALGLVGPLMTFGIEISSLLAFLPASR